MRGRVTISRCCCMFPGEAISVDPARRRDTEGLGMGHVSKDAQNLRVLLPAGGGRRGTSGAGPVGEERGPSQPQTRGVWGAQGKDSMGNCKCGTGADEKGLGDKKKTPWDMMWMEKEKVKGEVLEAWPGGASHEMEACLEEEGACSPGYLARAACSSSSFLASCILSSAICACRSAICSWKSLASPSSFRFIFSSSCRLFSSFFSRTTTTKPGARQ